MKNKTFIIDIDGTITNEDTMDYKNYSLCIPDFEMIHKINKLYETNKIILFSSRWKCDRKITKNWLKKYNIKYHKLILGKPLGDYYIDDKNVLKKDFLEKEFDNE